MGLFSKLIDKRIAAYQRELIETHYAEVETMYKQIRGWRHDYRNHIQTMKVYAAQEDWEALRRYLDLLDTDLNTVDTVVKTGNAMADAILNSKISLAKSRDIPVHVDAHIPVKLTMSELDLCCILGKTGGLFRTTKGEGHGFGLIRIDAIIDRLDGYLSRNSEDGAFTTEILIPQV